MSLPVWEPRPWQQPMLDLAMETPRLNLFARPGMGKTTATLAILDAWSMVEDTFPALVVGPMRVAQTVWDSEVRAWEQFRHLRVSKILGTASERWRALRQPADIYTIHYGLLTWLRDSLGDNWPFKTVVADESSRLRSMRCSYRRLKKDGRIYFHRGGTKNAAALAAYARRTPHWINLTGTPATNGLQNLWAQQWFIDQGSALGGSYAQFQQRWFYPASRTAFTRYIPFRHSFDEITERIKPNTISLSPEDWFDIKEPRCVTLEAELTPELRRQYTKLHQDAVLKLTEETEIVAASAMAVTNKCLQFASGHVYDGDSTSHPVHEIKLDLLESLIESQNGAPLLVAYHFKADKDAILRRFKQAVELPKGERQQAVQDKWNKGEIPVLLVHPASAGHGLNLQHGGCDIAIFTPTWDLELYEQVVERLGPTRQHQSGYDRVVSIYHLCIKNTFDQAVFARLASKASVQNTIMEAVKYVA